MLPEPRDPFAGDPADPARQLAQFDPPDDEPDEPLTPGEREAVLADLEEVEVLSALLEPRGVRGLVVPCEDCETDHHLDWDLLRGTLRRLLDEGVTGVHEPAFAPDADRYVTWDYARGYADGVADADEQDAPEDTEGPEG